MPTPASNIGKGNACVPVGGYAKLQVGWKTRVNLRVTKH